MVVQYTYQENDTYYFQRRVPSDLRRYYSKSKIVICLKTQSSRKAASAVKSICSKLDDYWFSLRVRDFELPASHLLVESRGYDVSDQPTIADALALYLRLKGKNRSSTFHTTAIRNIGYVTKCLGCRSIDKYSTADAGKFRDWLTDKGLSGSSIKRSFNSVKAVLNLAIQEHGIDTRNAFNGIYMPSNNDAVKRLPISPENIARVQNECIKVNDDLRWLIALISDSGLRLAEATGLHIDDLVLDDDIPHIIVQPHPWRTLKTPSSQRKVPLVGASLWAAEQISAKSISRFCFPRYTSFETCNANSASAALNKWIKTIGQNTDVMHGFRHSFRDRLRVAEIQTDLIDQLGGWSLQTIGQGYGSGYPLSSCHLAMIKAIEER